MQEVDPALILQCDPGELFVVRNVANIVPHYEKDEAHHGTSAALEFGICFLEVGHLILLGHSKCGGIQALLSSAYKNTNDFISPSAKSMDFSFCNALLQFYIVCFAAQLMVSVSIYCDFLWQNEKNVCKAFKMLRFKHASSIATL